MGRQEQIQFSGEQLAETLELEGGIHRSTGPEVVQPNIDLLPKIIQTSLAGSRESGAFRGIASGQDPTLEIERGGFEAIERGVAHVGGLRAFQVVAERFGGLDNRVPGLAGFGQPELEFRFRIWRHLGTHPMVSGGATGYRQ
jgi:hypothetical protein